MVAVHVQEMLQKDLIKTIRDLIADFVMLGGMLAGHDEGKGKLVKSNFSKYIEFYGSSSETANKKHYGGLSDYRSSEGRTVRVKIQRKN